MQALALIKQFRSKLKAQGFLAVASALARRVVPRRASCFRDLSPWFSAGTGLELGGPSAAFSSHGLFPAYDHARRIDNCNFGHQTLWEGAITEGATFRIGRSSDVGQQFVAEATDLGRIASSTYDFLLSSNTLEHVANPLRALAEWIRVLREDGLLVLVLPHRDGTFDHRRPVTTLSHLVQDFNQGMSEGDLTHLEEILALHDLRRDPAAGTFEAFAERSRSNLENRSLHHHVFDTRLAIDVVDHMGLQIVAVEAYRPYDILVVARKLDPASRPENGSFRAADSAALLRSPFATDHPGTRPEAPQTSA